MEPSRIGILLLWLGSALWVCSADTRESAPTASGGTPASRISVGPDILVSHDPRPHVELMLAANPREPGNLVGTAITWTRKNGGTACRAYVSKDRGMTWRDVELPEQTELGGGDPQVAFTPGGAALLSALGGATGPDGEKKDAVVVYRSEDGGSTWPACAILGLGQAHDHPVIVVDHSAGPFSGRVYVSTIYDEESSKVGLFHSADDGRTFTGPAVVIDGGGETQCDNGGMMALNDGTLFVGLSLRPMAPPRSAGQVTSRFSSVLSTDGGVTFSPPRPGPTEVFRLEERWLSSMPSYAIDPSARHRDRLFIAWTDVRLGPPRIFLSFSDDRGVTWTEPRVIDASAPAGALQYQPVVTVNAEGVVGLSWFDTRLSLDSRIYDQYFTASLDGGVSFPPPVRVSTESSIARGEGNFRPDPLPVLMRGTLRLMIASPVNRWEQGGDYMGLAASSGGAFHAFWADSRSGTFQIHTARLEVGVASGGGVEDASVADLATVDVTSKVEILFDPGGFDIASNEVILRVRIRNMSSVPIHGPVRIEITGFGEGMPQELFEWKKLAPLIVNASNGKDGPGAVFDYSGQLGPGDVLRPDAVSNSATWRLRLRDPARRPMIDLKVWGRAAE